MVLTGRAVAVEDDEERAGRSGSYPAGDVGTGDRLDAHRPSGPSGARCGRPRALPRPPRTVSLRARARRSRPAMAKPPGSCVGLDGSTRAGDDQHGGESQERFESHPRMMCPSSTNAPTRAAASMPTTSRVPASPRSTADATRRRRGSAVVDELPDRFANGRRRKLVRHQPQPEPVLDDRLGVEELVGALRDREHRHARVQPPSSAPEPPWDTKTAAWGRSVDWGRSARSGRCRRSGPAPPGRRSRRP